MIPQAFELPELRPAFLADKALDPALKAALKRFPAVEMPNVSLTIATLSPLAHTYTCMYACML